MPINGIITAINSLSINEHITSLLFRINYKFQQFVFFVGTLQNHFHENAM